jgi:hypothetical protein
MKKLAKKAAQFIYIMLFAALVTAVVMSALKLTGHNLLTNRWWDVLAIPFLFTMGIITIKELVAAKQEFLACVSILTAYAAWILGLAFINTVPEYCYSDLVALSYALVGAIAVIFTLVVYRKQIFETLIRDVDTPHPKCLLGVPGVIVGMTWLWFLLGYSAVKGIASVFNSPAIIFIIPILCFLLSLFVLFFLILCILLSYMIATVVIKYVIIFHKFAWKK